MPYVHVQDAFGVSYHISTRQAELLRQWFDEILPRACLPRRSGTDDPEMIWPHVTIHPMWAPDQSPDWLTDSRAMSRVHILQTRDGTQAMAELARIYAALEQELTA